MRNRFTWNIWILVIGIYLGFSAWNLGFAFNIYWADLHSHTSFSDGQGMPEEAYIYARDTANIDILALTDHTHYLNENAYQYTRNLANQYSIPGQFVAIAGQEFGSLSAFGHFSIFEADSLYPYSVNGLVLFYDWLSQHKAIAQFNHPQAGNFDYLVYNRNGGKYVSTLEIVNGSGTYTPFYEELYILALNNGWHVAPVANQDNHNRHWGDATTTLGQIPLVGVWADTLTKEKILEAIGNERVYAAEIKPADDKINLRDFSIGNSVMGDFYYTTDRNVTIKLVVDALTNFDKIYLYKNGVIYDSAPSNMMGQDSITWTYSDTITNGYYFVKGIQQDGDRFWTAPIWVNFKSGPTGIEAWPNPIRLNSQIRFPEVTGAISSEMTIYTMEGNEVFKQQVDYPTSHTWDGKDENGKRLDDGIYFVVIKVKTSTETKVFKGKVALLK